jgi:hypothetical protein
MHCTNMIIQLILSMERTLSQSTRTIARGNSAPECKLLGMRALVVSPELSKPSESFVTTAAILAPKSPIPQYETDDGLGVNITLAVRYVPCEVNEVAHS